MMNDIKAHFSVSYQEARAKFLAAAASNQLSPHSYAHPLPGLAGEALALDVVQDGDSDAARLLILSSACHGAEGFCGSGVQVYALQDQAWRDYARTNGVTILYLHALNPYGFSHMRRTTQENIDLNRNFQDFSQPLPVNERYRELHSLLIPAQWPPDESNLSAIAGYIGKHGIETFQAAVSGGQYEFADGLFFGGHAPSWSNRTVRQVLREYGCKAHQIAWIDLHTGLGPNGLGERIFTGKNDPIALQRARQWWSSGGATPITSIDDGSSSSANLSGLMWAALLQECPDAQATGIAMEYGTVPLLDVFQALRADHWLHLHPEAEPKMGAQIRQQMRDTFYSDTDEWRGKVIAQARQALFQAVAGLSGAALPELQLKLITYPN
jgi:Protein of unknown function (DUF2817)